jgi:chromosome segregation ATPase
MSINVKKYTKDQMAKMVEDSQAEVQELRRVNAALTEQIDQMNGEAINKANEIANLKADADVLRNKLADTEAALGWANAKVSHYKSELRAARKGATDAQWAQIDEYRRAEYAESHPWRNLWAWVKRKLVRHE